MSNTSQRTLLAGADAPVSGASEPDAPPTAFAEGSGVQPTFGEFDALTAAMLPASLDDADLDGGEPDLTVLDGKIQLCDLTGDADEAPDDDGARAAGTGPQEPVNLGIPDFDEPPLDLDLAAGSDRAPEVSTSPTASADATAATADAAPDSGGAVLARGSSQHAAMVATAPPAIAAAPTTTAAPEAAATERPSAAFSAEFARGGASVHVVPLVRAGFIMAGLASLCVVAWYLGLVLF